MPRGRTSFEERLSANKPGEERMLKQLRELLVSYGARKHDGDGFFHFPGHGWVCVECKNRVRDDGCFYWEKESYHDAQAKLEQCQVLVVVNEEEPMAAWLTDVRIVGAKSRTASHGHTSGDPAYIVNINGEDGRGQFLPLGQFVRNEAKREGDAR
jgi:hypothetical protein